MMKHTQTENAEINFAKLEERIMAIFMCFLYNLFTSTAFFILKKMYNEDEI